MTRNRCSHVDKYYGKSVYSVQQWKMKYGASSMWLSSLHTKGLNSVEFVDVSLLMFMIIFIMCYFPKQFNNRKKSASKNSTSYAKVFGIACILTNMQPACLLYFAILSASIVFLKLNFKRSAEKLPSVIKHNEGKSEEFQVTVNHRNCYMPLHLECDWFIVQRNDLKTLLIIAGDVEENPGPTQQEQDDAIHKYIADLTGVKDKWFMIGSSLKIPMGELHSFEVEYLQDSDRSLTAVISYWVYNLNGAGKPNTLCDALKEVNESRLAVKLRRKYELESSGDEVVQSRSESVTEPEEDMIKNVVLDLKGINWKWYSFGTELQMNHGVLKSLELKYLNDPSRLLLEVAYCWLRNYEDDDCVKPISDALVAMKEESLAFQIRSKYGTDTAYAALPESVIKKPRNASPETTKKISQKDKESWSFLPALTYPGLELDENLSNSQRENFEIKLKKQSQEMAMKFARILTKFSKFLKNTNVDIDDLKWALQIRSFISTMLRDEIDQPTIRKDLEKADTIAKIMRIICSYCSFFNYTLLYDLFDQVDYDEGKYLLDEHQKDFEKYAEQRVIYCPFGIKPESSETTAVVFTLDEKFKDCKILHINQLQDDLAKIFHLELTSIFVCGVKPGSVCITFLLPICFQERFTAFSSKQVQQLKELKYEDSEILEVKCEETKQIIHELKVESDICSDSGYGVSISTSTSMTLDVKSLVTKNFIESVTLRELNLKSNLTETASLIENYDNPDSYPSFLTLAESAIQLQSPIHEKAQEGDLEGVKNMIDSYNPMDIDDKGNTALHYAAANAHLDVLKYFVDDLGINPYIAGHNGLTLLHMCCYHGHLHLVKYLLDECSLDPTCYDEQKLTPLHYACSSGHTDVVSYIVDYISKQNLGQLKDILDDSECGCTPLLVACSSGYLQLVQYLISLNCNEQATDLDFNSLLHRAVLNGHLSVVKYLTRERNFKMDAKSQNGMTPLHYAAMKGHLDIVDFLITTSGCDPAQLVDNRGCNPLHIATLFNQISIVQYLIETKGMDPSSASAQTGYTPLHLACIKGNLTIVQYLTVEKKCDPNIADKFGMTPLFGATYNGSLEVLKFLITECHCNPASVGYDSSGIQLVHVAAAEGHLKVLSYLIEEKKCNPSAWAVDKITPLHIAVTNGQLDVVKYLVQSKGADVEAKIDNSEDTPLFIAAVYGHEYIIRYFLEEIKLDKDTVFKGDYHLLHVAAANGHLSIFEYLTLNKKCDTSIRTLTAGYSPLHFAALRGNLKIIKFCTDNQKSDQFHISSDKDTLLHAACIGGNLDVVKYLTQTLDASPNIGNISGMTAFHYAVYYGFHDIVTYLLNETKVNISAVDNFDRNVLHFATRHLNIFKYLVEMHGCSVNKHDEDNKTPIHVAAMEGDLEVLKYIIEMDPKQELDSKNIKPLHIDSFSWEKILTKKGRNALQLATLNGHVDIVRYLVEVKDWSTQVKDSSDNFLLHLAAGTGHLATLKYLVSKLSSDYFWEKNADSNIALQVAVIFNYFEIFKYLFSVMPWTPEHLVMFGSATLLIAVYHDRLKYVRYLVEECNCDPSWPVVDVGETPVHTAARLGWLSIINYFIFERNIDPGYKNLIDATPLHLAVQEGHLNVVQSLLSSKQSKTYLQARLNIDGLTPLHLAAMNGHLNVLKHLVDIEGCDPSILDDKRNTPLHYAALNGYLSMVKSLINEYNCNPLCRDVVGNTPLHIAALRGFLDIVYFLTTDTKCDPLPIANDGQTPITAAVLAGQIPVLLYYINSMKCSPYIKDNTDATPLHYAALSGQIDIIKFLLSTIKPNKEELLDNEGAHPIHYASYGGQIESLVHLLQSGFSPDMRDRYGRSCLHYAATGGHLPLVRAFVEQLNSSPNLQSHDGVSPLHVASWQGHLEVVLYLTKICNCSPEVKDSMDDMPLHWAASEGRLDVVKYFVDELGVSPLTKGSEGNSLEYAVYYGHTQLADYLKSKLPSSESL